MSENTSHAGAEKDDKSALDLIEEALVGSHQEVPGSENENTSEDDHDPGPPVPGHRSP